MEKKRILVIGAGVIGLTTTYALTKQGHHVTVLSEKYADAQSTSAISSEVAAGIWQLGSSMIQPRNKDEENKMKTWAMQTYKVNSEFANLSKNTGVYIRKFYFVDRKKIDDMPNIKKFMVQHKNLPGFCHSPKILQGKGFSPDLKDCFAFEAPIVDTNIFLEWIYTQCAFLGVKFCLGSIRGVLKDQIENLKRTFEVDFIINCTGFAARELADDPDVYPLRGASFVLQIPDGNIPDFVCACTTDWHEGDGLDGHVMITTKGKDKLYLGTIWTEKEIRLTQDHPFIQRMLRENIAVYPPLAKMIATNKMTLINGVRPMRKGFPRVEQDPACQSLIHNYGHGSFGYILSWGCAEDVLRIIDKTQPLTSKL